MARKTGSRTRTGKTTTDANPDQTGIGADSAPAEVTPVEEVAQPPLVAESTPVGGDSVPASDGAAGGDGVAGDTLPGEIAAGEIDPAEAMPAERMPAELMPTELMSTEPLPEETAVEEPAAFDPASAAVDIADRETLEAGALSDPSGTDHDLIAPASQQDPAPDTTDGAGPVMDTDAAALASGTPEASDTPASAETEPAFSPTVTEPAGGTPPPPPAPPPAPAGSAVPLVLGGMFAAVLGAVVVLFLLPQGWQGGNDSAMADRIAALENRDPAPATVLPDNAVTADQLEALDSRLAALEASLEAALADQPEAPQADLTPLEDRLASLEDRLAEPTPDAVTPDQLNTALNDMTTRLAGLEDALTAQIDSAVETAMADARAEIDTRTQGLDTREGDVASAQAVIARRTALASLTAAAESGEAAPQALAELPDAPAALAPLGDGIATLPALQQQFPGAARDALRADPVPPDASLGVRVTEFMRSQTGARSL
ncbi:MAG: hypothetical protein ACK4GT_07695, partial [Pararhodobacter sp.]